MIRVAQPLDAEFIRALWLRADNRVFLDPPAEGQIEEAIAGGDLLLWLDAAEPVGFALIVEWLPRVLGLREFAVSRPGPGRPFLEALMTEVFTRRQAHRLGLDCTADNSRALRFFESAGFQREGVWRECWQRPDGDWVDCVFMSMLEREWQTRGPWPPLAAPVRSS
ncbi:GNAT family protein [uncultured Gemmobacter sp.]|uniref:GNAT family N-acetyltransferase n=1 Tax=uncultured Gemmobacter sp. TaxID=1095917 RepID=UPI000A84F0D9|nr:GNAT family protein [uncultured Gemmobacter sp.]